MLYNYFDKKNRKNWIISLILQKTTQNCCFDDKFIISTHSVPALIKHLILISIPLKQTHKKLNNHS